MVEELKKINPDAATTGIGASLTFKSLSDEDEEEDADINGDMEDDDEDESDDEMSTDEGGESGRDIVG